MCEFESEVKLTSSIKCHRRANASPYGRGKSHGNGDGPNPITENNQTLNKVQLDHASYSMSP